MYNATWEDWERWYASEMRRRRSEARGRRGSSASAGQRFRNYFSGDRVDDGGTNPRQQTVYANNYAFISLIFVLAALGGAGQATRANEGAKTRLERSQIVNDETSRVLMAARQNSLEYGGEGRETKEGRIKRFLREADGYEEGEADGRALREGDEGLCAPGLVGSKGEKRFWEKPPER